MTHLSQNMLKENVFHLTIFNCYFISPHTLNTSHILGIAFHQTWKHHIFLKVMLLLSFSDTQLFPFISNSLQLLKDLLLWFSKYLCTSSVVSIKGTWTDIKASSWIIYPWQRDCTFHLKCEQSYNVEICWTNLLLRLQPQTEMAILGFDCKMWMTQL